MSEAGQVPEAMLSRLLVLVAGTLAVLSSCQGEEPADGKVASIVWVKIPKGQFMMGCSPGDDTCTYIEEPVHSVDVAAFQIMDAEVTEAQYEAAMDGANPSCEYNEVGGDEFPVECVTWYEASAFCKAVGARLCTEAEWEYAARGGAATRYYCGDDVECLGDVAWYDENSGTSKHAVRSKQPNAYGVYDMLGNVEEWVADCWHNTYDSAPSTAFPGWAQDCGKHWVSRGGSFAACSGFQRVSHRSGYYPNSFWEFGVGFRCCR